MTRRNRFGLIAFRIQGRGRELMLNAPTEEEAIREVAIMTECSPAELRAADDFRVEALEPEIAELEVRRALMKGMK